jgi:hypothetical protein
MKEERVRRINEEERKRERERERKIKGVANRKTNIIETCKNRKKKEMRRPPQYVRSLVLISPFLCYRILFLQKIEAGVSLKL